MTRSRWSSTTSQFRWFGHLTSTPPGSFLGEVFWTYPTGRRPRTPRREYISQLAWNWLCVPRDKLEEVELVREVWASQCATPWTQRGWVDACMHGWYYFTLQVHIQLCCMLRSWMDPVFVLCSRFVIHSEKKKTLQITEAPNSHNLLLKCHQQLDCGNYWWVASPLHHSFLICNRSVTVAPLGCRLWQQQSKTLPGHHLQLFQGIHKK